MSDDKEIFVIDDNRESYPSDEDLAWVSREYGCRLAFADPTDPITTGLQRVQQDRDRRVLGISTDSFEQRGQGGKTPFWHVRELRRLRPDLIIGVNSGSLSSEVKRQEAREAGADACFRKGESLEPFYESRLTPPASSDFPPSTAFGTISRHCSPKNSASG